MCGIAGIYSEDRISELQLTRMGQAISHRGPDNSGIYLDPPSGMSYRRLSIIDTNEQKQPILHNEDRSLRISFNGEIYNFHKLKDQLVKKGHKFYTNTDTEMILHLYEEKGDNCVKDLNGIFAFAIWDAKKEKLLLARDHLGVKPLYYTETGSKFIYGSEIKALLVDKSIKREVDSVALDAFMSLRYVPGPRTIFKNIYKLPPGHILVIQNGSKEVRKYWDYSFSPVDRSNQETDHLVKSLLTRSIEMQLLSDVPLGAFLSGGIDSSIVVGVMSKIMKEPVKTFSIGFKEEGRYDERNFARFVSDHFKTDHEEIIIDYDSAKSLPEVVYHLDEPMADPAAIPTLLLSRMARKKVTVVLTGEGSDEIFGGYQRDIPNSTSVLFSLLSNKSRKDIAGLISRLPNLKGKRYLYRGALSYEDRAVHILSNAFTKYSKFGLYRKQIREEINLSWQEDIQKYLNHKLWDEMSKMLYLETKIWLVDDPLAKVDKMSMASSLEARVPFLNPDLVELAATIPSSLKNKDGISKYILRNAMREYLPDQIFKRPKHGFDVPIDRWIRKELNPMVKGFLSRDSIEKTKVFNYDTVQNILNLHQSNHMDLSFEIWNILNFQIWHKIFIQGEKWQNIST